MLPDNVLFEGGAGEKIRRKLLETCERAYDFAFAYRHLLRKWCKSECSFFDNASNGENANTKGCGTTIYVRINTLL